MKPYRDRNNTQGRAPRWNRRPIVAIAVLGGWIAGGYGISALADPVIRPPVIRHSPPRAILRGQGLSLRAQAVPGAAPIRTVTLFGTSSRDMAPSPLPMTSAGAGAYVVTVPPGMIGEGDEFTYYIEALDSLETSGETPWYSVRVRAPSHTDAHPPMSDPDMPQSRDRAGWVTPAIIAGGATLVVGGVALATRDSSSSSSPHAGEYVGSVTRILRVNGTNTVESHRATLHVTENRRVHSEDLHPNTRLEGSLTGSTFLLSATVTDLGMEGTIRYFGSVADNQIAGSIDGEVSDETGRQGTYSGSFTATRQ